MLPAISEDTISSGHGLRGLRRGRACKEVAFGREGSLFVGRYWLFGPRSGVGLLLTGPLADTSFHQEKPLRFKSTSGARPAIGGSRWQRAIIEIHRLPYGIFPSIHEHCDIPVKLNEYLLGKQSA